MLHCIIFCFWPSGLMPCFKITPTPSRSRPLAKRKLSIPVSPLILIIYGCFCLYFQLWSCVLWLSYTFFLKIRNLCFILVSIFESNENIMKMRITDLAHISNHTREVERACPSNKYYRSVDELPFKWRKLKSILFKWRKLNTIDFDFPLPFVIIVYCMCKLVVATPKYLSLRLHIFKIIFETAPTSKAREI